MVLVGLIVPPLLVTPGCLTHICHQFLIQLAVVGSNDFCQFGKPILTLVKLEYQVAFFAIDLSYFLSMLYYYFCAGYTYFYMLCTLQIYNFFRFKLPYS